MGIWGVGSAVSSPIPETPQTRVKSTLADDKPQLCTLASFKLTCLVFKHITRYLEGPVFLLREDTSS